MSGEWAGGVRVAKRILNTRPCMEPFVKHVSLKQRQGNTEVPEERPKQEVDKDQGVLPSNVNIKVREGRRIYLQV